MLKELDNRKQILIVALCVIIVITAFVTFGVLMINENMKRKDANNIELDMTTLTVKDASVPSGSRVLTEEEFYKMQSGTDFNSYSEYLAAAKAGFSDIQSSGATSLSDNVSNANTELYNLCDQYFQCYYGSTRVSPIFPMAIANAETGDRMDPTKTWSALFPSAIVDTSKISSFCVTDVISDKRIFEKLGSDYSTRDRGALQMSGTYGTGDHELNEQMSGTEKDKLKAVNTKGFEDWVKGASSNPGDRFYIPDALMRLQAAMSENIQNMTANSYTADNDIMLIAQLAVAHNSGKGIWSNSSRDSAAGNWVSSQRAYEWCEKLASDEVYQKIVNYADSHGSIYITRSTAATIVSDVNKKYYTTNEINLYYTVQVLYNYVKLERLYSR